MWFLLVFFAFFFSLKNLKLHDNKTFFNRLLRLFPFYTPWKHQKTYAVPFLYPPTPPPPPRKQQKTYRFLFSGGIKREHRAVMGHQIIICRLDICKQYTAWRVSVFRDFLVRIFPHSDWVRRDTSYLFVFSPNAGKCGSEKLQIRTLFAHWYTFIYFFKAVFS